MIVSQQTRAGLDHLRHQLAEELAKTSGGTERGVLLIKCLSLLAALSQHLSLLPAGRSATVPPAALVQPPRSLGEPQ
jgi:hypothetical protein